MLGPHFGMRTIVVVCVPTRDAGLSGLNNGSFQWGVDSGTRIMSRSLKPSKRKESTPPFWTWFIENPRSPGAA